MTTEDQVDLALAVNAPDYVAVDANFMTNIAYEYAGTISAPDARVTATLPGDVLTYTLQLPYQPRAGEPNQCWVALTRGDSICLAQASAVVPWPEWRGT